MAAPLHRNWPPWAVKASYCPDAGCHLSACRFAHSRAELRTSKLVNAMLASPQDAWEAEVRAYLRGTLQKCLAEADELLCDRKDDQALKALKVAKLLTAIQLRDRALAATGLQGVELWMDGEGFLPIHTYLDRCISAATSIWIGICEPPDPQAQTREHAAYRLRHCISVNSGDVARQWLMQHRFKRAELLDVVQMAIVSLWGADGLSVLLQHWKARGLDVWGPWTQQPPRPGEPHFFTSPGTRTPSVVHEMLERLRRNFSSTTPGERLAAELAAFQRTIAVMRASIPNVLSLPCTSLGDPALSAAICLALPMHFIAALAPPDFPDAWRAAACDGRGTNAVAMAAHLAKMCGIEVVSYSEGRTDYYLNACTFLEGREREALRAASGDAWEQPPPAPVGLPVQTKEEHAAAQAAATKAATEATAQAAQLCPQFQVAVASGSTEAVELLDRLRQLAAEHKRAVRRALGDAGNLSEFVSSTLLMAPRLSVVVGILDLCSEHHTWNESSKSLTSPDALPYLLATQNFSLLEQLLDPAVVRAAFAGRLGTLQKQVPAAMLVKSSAPPLVEAITREAPLSVVSALVAACSQWRADRGGVDEAASDGATAVGLAIQRGNLSLLQQLLDQSLCMHLRWSYKGDTAGHDSTPLFAAIAQRQMHLVLPLLDHAHRLAQLHRGKQGDYLLESHVGAPCGGSTALSKAYEFGDMITVAALLAAGAYPLAPVQLFNQQTTVAHAAAEKEDLALVKTLLDSLDTSARSALLATAVDFRQHTLLHVAVRTSQPLLVRLLLVMGSSLLPFTPDSPLVLALEQQGQPGGAARANAVRRELLCGWSAEHTVGVLGPDLQAHHQTVLQFVEKHAKTTLHPILSSPDQQLAALQRAADIADSSPLLSLLLQQQGVKAAGVKLHDVMGRISVGALAALLDAGAEMSQRDAQGVSLAHKAVEVGDVAAVEELLARGLPLGERDREGNTLMHFASWKTPGDLRESVMEFLYQKSPTFVWVTNSKDETPRAFTRNKRAKRLLQTWEEEAAAAGYSRAAGSWEDQLGRALEDARHKGTDQAAATGQGEDLGDLTVLGPLDESDAGKRLRLAAMLQKLPLSLAAAEGGAPPSLHAATPAPAAAADKGAGLKAAVEAAVAAVLPDMAASSGGQPGGNAATSSDEEEGAAAPAALLEADDGGAGMATNSELAAALQGLPWEFVCTKEACLEWSGLDLNFRRMVLLKLRQLGQGTWAALGSTKRLITDNKALELWRCKFTRAGRILFDIAPDFSGTSRVYKDLIRIWSITLDHKRYNAERARIPQSFAKSYKATAALRLVPLADPGAAGQGGGGARAGGPSKVHQRLPVTYRRDATEEEGDEGQEAAGAAGGSAVVEHFPPATAFFSLLKFYDLSSDLARAILAGMAEQVDTPFRVSPAETRIIELNPGRSIILAGRSGTGKTTVATFRLFARWMAAWHTGEPCNQVFVTASGTLRREVARAFCKMRRAVVPPDVADALEAASTAPLHALRGVPGEAFPLFLSQRSYLEALDGTLKQPFFPRRDNGSILWEQGADGFDPDGMSMEIDLGPEGYEAEYALGSLSDEELSDAGSESGASQDGDDSGKGTASKGRRWQRQEVGYAEFAAKWKQFASQEARAALAPALAWTDLVSFIKGSAEAVRGPAGHLTLEQYLEVGRKRAPTFEASLRPLVFQVFLAFERYKNANWRYDTADVVAHLSRRLAVEGYSGTPIHAVFRDEVQDFMQGELLLDLRVCCDPNNIFLCGDTAQAIARGVGFRFADVRSMFFEEGAAALAAQRLAQQQTGVGGTKARVPLATAGAPLLLPTIEHLSTNYRTHSGILDAASAVVDVLRRFFPMHIDSLQREVAFFQGPKVLLVCGAEAEDVARLLSWSDRSSSQVEFGAHQVVLVRSEASKERLPAVLRSARPLTVPQAKGLEFDDVLLYNFFSDSPTLEEWRCLLTYLDELEQTPRTGSTPASSPATSPDKAAARRRRRLLPADEASAGVGALGRGSLRPLAFDPARCKLLCDELKHLYTALTRAKNFAAIVDCDPQARAPFYYFLARLGLGRVVTDVSEIDKSDLGLSKHRSSPADWAQRGYSLMELRLFDTAALDFRTAGDPAMERFCEARGALHRAVELAAEQPEQARQLYLHAGLLLVDLAVNGQPNLELNAAIRRRGQVEYGRRVWARYAAAALERAGETHAAATVLVYLGAFKRARRLLMAAGHAEEAAQCCVQAADALLFSGARDSALSWAREAFRQFKSLGLTRRCFDLLEATPGLGGVLGSGEVDAVAWEAMDEAEAEGNAARAVAASRHMSQLDLRRKRLWQGGHWSELAEVTPDAVQAAELLLEHEGFKAAAARLLRGTSEAPQQAGLPSEGVALLCRCALGCSDVSLLPTAFGAATAGSKVAATTQAHLALHLALLLLERHPITLRPASVDQIADDLDAALKLALHMGREMCGALQQNVAPPPDLNAEVWQRGTQTMCRQVEAALELCAAGAGLGSQPKFRLVAAAALAALALAQYVSSDNGLGVLRSAAVLTCLPEKVRITPGQLQFALSKPLAALSQALSPQPYRRPGSADVASPAGADLLEELKSHLGLIGLPPKQFLLSLGASRRVKYSWRAYDGRFPALAEHYASVSATHKPAAKLGTPDSLSARPVPVAHVLMWHLHGLAHAAATLLAGSPAGSQRLPQLLASLHVLQTVRSMRIAATRAGLQHVLGGEAIISDDALWHAALRAVFPVGVADDAVNATGGQFSVQLAGAGMEPLSVLDWAGDPFVKAGSVAGVSALMRNPGPAFTLWRVSAFLVAGSDADRAGDVLQRRLRSVAHQAQTQAEGVLLLRLGKRQEHPATLLLYATQLLQVGQPAAAVRTFMLYLTHCRAATHLELPPAGQAGRAARVAPPLGLEETVWLLELATALLGLACSAGTMLPCFLPTAVAAALERLPGISAPLQERMGQFSQPGQVPGLLQSVGRLVEATAQQAAAHWVAAERRQLAGRLALSAGTLVASAAMHKVDGRPRFSADDVAALCHGTVSAVKVAYSSRTEASVRALLEATAVGGLLAVLDSMAKSLETTLLCCLPGASSGQGFDSMVKQVTDTLAFDLAIVAKQGERTAGQRRLGSNALHEVQRALDTGESEEVRRASAAQFIQRYWRARRKQWQRAAALRVLQASRTLCSGVARWRKRFKLQKRRAEQEEEANEKAVLQNRATFMQQVQAARAAAGSHLPSDGGVVGGVAVAVPASAVGEDVGGDHLLEDLQPGEDDPEGRHVEDDFTMVRRKKGLRKKGSRV